MVTLAGSPFKGNQLKAETGNIVHFWLLVERDPHPLAAHQPRALRVWGLGLRVEGLRFRVEDLG